MLLLINNTVKNNTSLSSVPQLKTALQTLHIPFYEVSGKRVHPEVMNPTSPIFKSITGIIISGSSIKISQLSKDISKHVYIFHYLQLFQHVPVLGICFGAQLLVMLYGGDMVDNQVYTRTSSEVQVLKSCKLFRRPPVTTKTKTKPSSTIVASFHFSDIPILKNSRVKPVAWVMGNTASLAVAYEFERGRVYGCLFHPELNADTYFILKNMFAGY